MFPSILTNQRIPVKCIVSEYDDAFNFYVSQLRITIERAFGVLIHRWAILRRPLTSPLAKVGPFVMCLCRLHNYCIDQNKKNASASSSKDAIYAVHYMDALRRFDADLNENATLVWLENGWPDLLLHGGSHFADAPHNCTPTEEDCPMDKMLAQVKHRNLLWPTPRVYD